MKSIAAPSTLRPSYPASTIDAYDLDGTPPALLTIGNPKTAKGEKSGYLTAILHLSPAGRSGTMNTCPYASDGCASACLNTAGRGGIALDGEGLNMIQAARIRRTRFFKRDRAGFMAALDAEIAKHVRTAARHGLKPAVRLNGTSDLPWERLKLSSGETLIEKYPEARFYDYTKWDLRKRGHSASYPLTFSLSESNERLAGIALDQGANVAVVFDTKKSGELPASYTLAGRELKVIDGDLSDLRFLDASGVIVGLRAKGTAKGSETGFVRKGN